MSTTTFSGPVISTEGFSGSALSATVLTAASGTVTNLLATSLTVGTLKFNVARSISGTVSAQAGYIMVMVGATTAYIALYSSLTP